MSPGTNQISVPRKLAGRALRDGCNRATRRAHNVGLLFLTCLVLSAGAENVAAQTALRAHYADGQVWVVWQADSPLPETFGIYASTSPIVSLTDAELVGRLFEYEYTPGALRDQLGPSDRGWVIPAAGGAGVDTLTGNEALFVETVRATEDRYYAVVVWGDTAVNSDNATTVPASAIFGPGETVSCHLQSEFSTLSGYTTRAYAMWADGRDDPEDRRPDFPIMANAAKNGMPSLFMVSVSDDLGPGAHPVAYWLHGGGGTAKQSTPGSRRIYDINPDVGLLVAHNDDLVRQGIEGAGVLEEEGNSWWFGWGIHHDPFTGPTLPSSGEVIVNYTQRRILWIHDWLILQGWVDPERTSLLGHSLGSAGTTALGKAFPNSFASCTIFNNGFAGPNFEGVPHELYGDPNDDLKTNLIDAQGDSVGIFEAFDLNTPTSAEADFPFLRSFHGKNDDNGVMEWDAFVVAEYRRADSLGWGMHLYWDERPHAPSSDDSSHWASGFGMMEQTERDNVDYQDRYLANRSFPAFYNHRLQAGADDPGDGTGGTGEAGVGDDWGTWGGYQDWDVSTLVDEADFWEVTTYLIGQSDWTVDNSPTDSLISSLMIRKPQSFLPAPGEPLLWDQVEVASGDTIRSGALVADAEGRVHLNDFVTYRDPLRTRIRIRRPEVSAVGGSEDNTAQVSRLSIAPNPFRPQTTLRFNLAEPGPIRLTVHDLQGRTVATPLAARLAAGEHVLVWNGRDDRGRRLAAGSYWLRWAAEGVEDSRQVTLLK